MRPPKEQINAVYQQLLADEPDAPSLFIELLLDPLTAALETRFPHLPDPDLIIDVVTDTLFRFVQAPGRYQPARGDLWQYLYRDAYGDVLNSLAKEQRRYAKEIAFDLVAHDLPDGNNIEEEVAQQLDFTSLLGGKDAQTFLKQLRTVIPDPHEWQVALLMFQGERRTNVFAAALGIEHLPITAQRIQVKQTKDRLRLRLKRYGVKIHEH